MDINGFSREPLIMLDSNPGRIEYCPGGVGRNIAENLHRLGIKVYFIGVIGDDPGGEFIRKSSARNGLNIEHSLFLKGEDRVTSVYLALMDRNGEMKLALADMDIMDKMTEEHLKSKTAIISQSTIVVLDTNLPEKIISFITDRFKNKPVFFLDAVSAKKAERARSAAGFLDTIKLSRAEASALSGIAIPENSSLQNQEAALGEAASWFLDRGTRRVFITLGKEGVYAAARNKHFLKPAQYVRPVNTSGAGDAFMAGIVYGTLKGWDDEKTAVFSLAMAKTTVQSNSAVSPSINLEMMRRGML